MALHDEEAKQRLGYKDAKTIVWLDGREKLKGKDWKQRQRELYKRSGGKCEVPTCTRDADDAHHVIPRSKQRDDRIGNLLHVCRWHHWLLDKRKVRWTQKEATA